MVRRAAIIGGGPAALSAATWMGRHRQTAVLIDAGEHRNRWVDHAQGYLGRDSLDPRALIEHATRDLANDDTISVLRARATHRPTQPRHRQRRPAQLDRPHRGRRGHRDG